MPRKLLPTIKLDDELIPDSELAYDTCVSKGLIDCLDRKALLTGQSIHSSEAII